MQASFAPPDLAHRQALSQRRRMKNHSFSLLLGVELGYCQSMRELKNKPNLIENDPDRELNWKKLRAVLNPAELPYADSRGIVELNNSDLEELQPRAIQAIKTALKIKNLEYNIYLAGEINLGRTFFIKDFLQPQAAKAPVPPDLICVYNFQNPDCPEILKLPSGQAKELKTLLSAALFALREEIPNLFESESYTNEKSLLQKDYNAAKHKLHAQMEEMAAGSDFSLEIDGNNMTLFPVIEKKIVSTEEFDTLDYSLKRELKTRGEKLFAELTKFLRSLAGEERSLRTKEKNLDRGTLGTALDIHLAPVLDRFSGLPEVTVHLQALREDIVKRTELFLSCFGHSSAHSDGGAGISGSMTLPGAAGPTEEESLDRYDINILVDNSETNGAPIVILDHPTHANLMGCIERESELGALYTDFSLVRAGALHRALGGFLLIKAEDILENTPAWEALLRALRAGHAHIEDQADDGPAPRTKTIVPKAIDLDLKIILIGTDEVYEELLYTDERFAKLFKIKAHLRADMPRDSRGIELFLRILVRIINDSQLLPFDSSALAGLVDYASLLAEDQTKLSLEVPLCREVMLEAAALAEMEDVSCIDKNIIRKVKKSRVLRANLLEEEFLTEYDREMIKAPTSGRAVGRVNGLTVRIFGDYSFGLPHLISCTVGVGKGGILDLEREASLGGPIHTKGMMILKAYLLGLFAQDKPLVLSASICFEQSYATVEGDSASGAELAALLSALAEVPINLSLAFTGAVSQSGAILAVGGLNQKVEGFFDVCQRRKLTGTQGVIIPADNIPSLMLKDDVIGAVKKGLFHIYPVKTIEEAMQILTGLETGREPNKRFKKNSLYALVDRRLNQLAAAALRWDQRQPSYTMEDQQ